MAAGLGFKDFTTGEVLTAADVDGYLMQGVWVFASAAARDAAVTSPQEGNFAYLKDTNVTTYYTGSAWANLDTTGMVNPMTTTGDTIYSSSGSTPARLGIGSTGDVLTVAGGVPSWAAPAAANSITLLSTTSLTGASTTISGISGSYTSLYGIIYGVTNATANGRFKMAPNGETDQCIEILSKDASGWDTFGGDVYYLTNTSWSRTDSNNVWYFYIPNYSSTTVRKPIFSTGSNQTNSPAFGSGAYYKTTAITSLVFSNAGGNLSTGTVLLYGVK